VSAERADSPEVRVLLSTAPPDAADALARALVEERLAACVNVVPGVKSTYRWEGKIEVDDEVMLVIKCVQGGLDSLLTRLEELHPYDVPEALALPVDGGSARYLNWVRDACAPDGAE
jgi:periplasmic divalent cation tolerance protein